MKWCDCYSRDEMPDFGQITEFVATPLWNEFCTCLQSEYGVTPNTEYSTCSGAPGWNVKYRKSGRALCTLYPDEGFFTCLLTIGTREATEAELLLPLCTETVRSLWNSANPMNGARWLMIPVKSAEILEDAKRLVALRVKSKHK